MIEPTPTRLRWYQYSLRSFLIFICLLCVFFAWIAKERAQSKRELEIAEQLRERYCHIELGGPYDKGEWDRRTQKERPPQTGCAR